MAQSSQTPQEFIQNAFSPMVAVMNSPAVDFITQKNNLSFVELLQPFSRLNCEGYIKDPSGTHCSVRNLKLTICNVNTRPPQPILARKFLNESVSNSYSEKTVNLQFGNYYLDIPTSTPWFEAWRETFFHVQFPSDHEYTKHFVACILIVSTSEANPTETMAHMAQQLSQLQNVTPPKLPRWFNTNVLRSYVLLHDALEGNISKAEKYYESIKHTYGAGNCFFLAINSRNPNETDSGVLPDPWSKFLVRRVDNTDTGSDKDSLPRTPADMASVTGMPVTLESGVPGGRLGPSPPPPQEPGGAVTVQVHPLSPSEEADASSFQNNCLQNEALTTSLESDVGIINPNVWEPTSANGGVTHGTNLTTQDIENIKMFVQDFALKALLPYFERQLYQLQDAVSNKKGVSRSLLSATKRWFGTNKPGTNPPLNTVIYTGDCPELQLRRMADIWFMLGQWGVAYQAYHAAKREYSADGAWLLYAGALEMAALSAFMGNEASRKTFDYMEESIITYMNSCRMPQYAVRATLLSLQCLHGRGLHGEAARQLIRMTSEECDLRSALLLEQAALCFLAGPPRKALPRKYAFHMVLAGHRYSKAGQRKHSLRCYRQAYQVYRGGGWRLATDHIEFAVGRLAGQVGEGWWGAAASALASLLAPRSLQSPAQQHAFLREYLYVRQQWLSNDPEQENILPILPVPILDGDSTVVWCGGAGGAPLSADTAPPAGLWAPLEEMLLFKARGTAPMLFKPSLSLFCNTSDNSTNPITPQGEPIQIIVCLQNPLLIDITILDVQLLWQFKSQTTQDTAVPDTDEVIFSNESCVTAVREYDKSIVITQKVPVVVLHSDRITNVSLSLTPLHMGELTIIGVAYRLCNPVPAKDESNPVDRLSVLGKQLFEIRGPKLKGVKEVGGEPQYGVDKRLNIVVVPPAPCLQITFTEVSSQLLCGELQQVIVEFRNVGRVPLKALYMGTSHPQYVSLSVDGDNPFSALLETRYLEPQIVQDERQLRLDRERRTRNRHCVKVLDSLEAGQAHSAALWLQAPHRPGAHVLHALFYYENTQPNALPKHRLLRHTWNIFVQDSIQVCTVARRTLRPDKKCDKYEEALNVALEVKNANQIHHGIQTFVEVQQASLLSQSWTLDDFVPIHRDVKLLNSQETLHLIMRARRSAVVNKTDDIISSDVRLDTNDSANIVSVSEKPYSCFVTDYSSIFDDSESANEVINYNDNISSDHQSINSTLVIRWKADITKDSCKRTAIGQHHLNLDTLNVKVSNLAQLDASRGAESLPIKLFGSESSPSSGPYTNRSHALENEKKLVTFSLEHQLEVRHDFRKTFVCIIPVKMHLVNCSTKDVVAVINTSSPKSSTYKYSGISWVGAGGNESGGVQLALSSLESGNIPLQIACTGPGTYSLGNILRVSCKLQQAEETRTVAQTHVATSTVIVTQAD